MATPRGATTRAKQFISGKKPKKSTKPAPKKTVSPAMKKQQDRQRAKGPTKGRDTPKGKQTVNFGGKSVTFRKKG